MEFLGVGGFRNACFGVFAGQLAWCVCVDWRGV